MAQIGILTMDCPSSFSCSEFLLKVSRLYWCAIHAHHQYMMNSRMESCPCIDCFCVLIHN